MKRDLVLTKPITSSFLSCEKDTETILRKLFVESRPYSDYLKRLLVIPNANCLDTSILEYKTKIDSMSLAKLVEEGYVILEPKISEEEFAKYKTRIVLWMDDFVPNATNPEFRDCSVIFEIICPMDCQSLGNYQLRANKILGYIDGLLNNSKLSGIGKLNFLGCSTGSFTENYSTHVLIYHAIHGSDDQIPNEETE